MPNRMPSTATRCGPTSRTSERSRATTTRISATYRLPLDKFPLINFTTADIRYQSTYRWDRAPFAQDSLGHTIQNSRNITLNAACPVQEAVRQGAALKDINSGKRKREWEKEQDKKKQGDRERGPRWIRQLRR